MTRRIVIEELCEHGNSGMHDYIERPLFPGCPGGSRTILDGPTDEMVERARESFKLNMMGLRRSADELPIRAALSAALHGEEDI
jgi:hypothetical protein